MNKHSHQIILLSSITIILAFLAVWQQQNAITANDHLVNTHARELAAQSNALQNKNFQLSLLLGVEAFKTKDIYQTRSALLDNMQMNPQLQRYLNIASDFPDSVYKDTNKYTLMNISPDGKMLASSNPDATISLWDATTGKKTDQLQTGYKYAISSLIFSPNGKLLASNSRDGSVILWDAVTHQRIGEPLNSKIWLIAFSPDGKILAGSASSTVTLWDTNTRQPIGETDIRDTTYITNLAFSPDGKMLAVANINATITLWNTLTRQPVRNPLKGLTSQMSSLIFSPDGKTILASGYYDCSIVIGYAKSGLPVDKPVEKHPDWECLSFGPDGKTIVAINNEHKTILWNVDTGESTELAGKIGWITSVSFSANGKTLATAAANGTITLWDTTPNQPITQILPKNDKATNLAISPNGKILASSYENKTIVLWDVSTGITTGTTTNKPIGQPLTGHTDQITSLTFSPDGKILASGSADRSILLWDVSATGKPIGKPLKRHSYTVTSLAFSPDGKMLASGSRDSTIILWNVSTRQPIGQPLTNHLSFITSLAFSPDGKILASGSYDDTVILWDVSATPPQLIAQFGQPIGSPTTGGPNVIHNLAFSPDGKTIAAFRSDVKSENTIIVWDIATHQMIGKPLTVPSESSIAFNPDGKTFASVSATGEIILWDAETHQPIGQPLAKYQSIYQSVDQTTKPVIVFSPNGKELAAISFDNSTRVWNLDPQLWIEKTCQRANRNLTHAEWALYFPDEVYHLTCPGYPAGD